jgi:hypothetical protein
MTATFAFAVGIRNTNGAGLVLDCLYPAPVMHPKVLPRMPPPASPQGLMS